MGEAGIFRLGQPDPGHLPETPGEQPLQRPGRGHPRGGPDARRIANERPLALHCRARWMSKRVDGHSSSTDNPGVGQQGTWLDRKPGSSLMLIVRVSNRLLCASVLALVAVAAFAAGGDKKDSAV